MSRMVSEQKLGFYPTPTKEMEYILKRITISQGESVTILDPCAGDGIPLEMTKNHLSNKGGLVTSYGVEIEESRANKAKQRIDHMLHCSYEEMQTSAEAFSFLYLNPPFQEADKERMEKTFMRDLTAKRLSPDGIFVFNLPQYVLKDCADLLTRRFEHIRVYRFTDENYDSYKQVIVYGVRRGLHLPTEDSERKKAKTKKMLEKLSQQGKDAFPPLDEEDWDDVQYTVKPALECLETFRSDKVTAQDILDSMSNAESVEEIDSNIEKQMSDIYVMESKKSLTPAMPLKTAHIATAIASGVLPEQMGEDHLLVGVSKRTRNEKNQINEKSGKEEKVVTTQPTSLIRIYSEMGIFNLR
ncbi:DUF6094 domain-containing protein [Bacillus piscicola]|uniref:DUF6094 domain-containing protein n=1 Tax=Bacillus piscicola TaxID=1632684 RepID=UPI001F09F32B|nr:DUF6094 domain-containing protein [Bacillus piscicola]